MSVGGDTDGLFWFKGRMLGKNPVDLNLATASLCSSNSDFRTCWFMVRWVCNSIHFQDKLVKSYTALVE